MIEPFIGSEAVATGRLTKYDLLTRFQRLYPDVYIAPGAELSAPSRAKAAWLWSGRRGVVAGRSAASLHGAKWVDANRPAEILCANRRAPSGIRVWSDEPTDDEITVVDGITVTTPARTALDLACRYPLGAAVAAVDALARATRLSTADVEVLVERYRGRRGIRSARRAVGLVDPGAESPKETWLRLLVMRYGFPRPRTQIPVYDEFGQLVAVLDLGWEALRLGLDYEGAHHREAVRFSKDIRRHDELTRLGWTDIRVTSLDTEAVIIARLTTEWQRRTCAQIEKSA